MPDDHSPTALVPYGPQPRAYGPDDVDFTPYLDLITWEHKDKPKFVATITTVMQPEAETSWMEQRFYLDYDLDTAIGAQLDAVGVWVGRQRKLSTPSGILSLDDDHYRLLLRAVIAANHWDGTIPNAYDAWSILYQGTGFTLLIQDWGNGEMAIGLVGPHPPDDIMQALFTSGELDMKPAGIRLWHMLPSVWPAGPGGAPIFGLDCLSPVCAGLDVSVWGLFFAPE